MSEIYCAHRIKTISKDKLSIACECCAAEWSIKEPLPIIVTGYTTPEEVNK